MAGFKLRAAAALLAGAAFAQTSDTIVGNGPAVNADGKYTIQAEGIRANFIPYGASISNLFVNDTNGIERDIVLGFDNASHYSVDTLHPHLGGVPGRYANRIKNSSFTIDGTTYNVTPNENLDTAPDTLHGGPDGWDWRNWTVVAHTTDSITFSLFDPDGKEGFPGDVVSYVTYTLTPHAWHLKMYATPLTKTTPIMLSSHTYWNLDGFQNNDTATALNYTLHLPYSGQRVGCDGNLIPTGEILPNQAGSVNDFWTQPKQIGADFPDALGNCGTGCRGYDTCFLINRAQDGPYDWRAKGPVATLGSDYSGIQIDIFTDQEAFQVYSCGGMNGTMPLKTTQGFFDDPSRPRVVEQYGCVVMEVEDWIDAINQPEWGRSKRNIFGPKDDPYTLEAVYEFSVKSPSATSYKEL